MAPSSPEDRVRLEEEARRVWWNQEWDRRRQGLELRAGEQLGRYVGGDGLQGSPMSVMDLPPSPPRLPTTSTMSGVIGAAPQGLVMFRGYGSLTPWSKGRWWYSLSRARTWHHRLLPYRRLQLPHGLGLARLLRPRQEEHRFPRGARMMERILYHHLLALLRRWHLRMWRRMQARSPRSW